MRVASRACKKRRGSQLDIERLTQTARTGRAAAPTAIPLRRTCAMPTCALPSAYEHLSDDRARDGPAAQMREAKIASDGNGRERGPADAAAGWRIDGAQRRRPRRPAATRRVARR